jgi:glycosyltransferase involved in cell wall biosynthesis
VADGGLVTATTVAVVLEHRFDRSPDGRVWTMGPFAHDFWTRYLSVFDRVSVLARVRDVAVAGPLALEVTGPGVTVAALPHYRGLAQYLRRRGDVRAAALRSVGTADAIILRLPSPIATLICPSLWSRGVPYAVEIVGDPHDVFSAGAVRHPLRPLLRWKLTRDLQRQVGHAVAAAYVTQHALQQRYPCPAFQVGISDVQLSHQEVASEPRTTCTRAATVDTGAARPVRLVSVGTFDQLYKGPDVLVDAVGICVRRGLDLTLRFVGSGAHLEQIRRRAARHRLADRVQFDGQVASRAELVATLDASDLFVLPSRADGLPRAMIEAMARALPCLGSTVGGIPELLDAQDTVPPGDAAALARKIEEVVTSPRRLSEMSRRCLDRVRAFDPEALAAARQAFYRRVLVAARTAMAA